MPGPTTFGFVQQAALNACILPAYHFGTERIILFFAPYRLTAVSECSNILAIPTNPCPESVLKPRRLSALRLIAPL